MEEQENSENEYTAIVKRTIRLHYLSLIFLAVALICYLTFLFMYDFESGKKAAFWIILLALGFGGSAQYIEYWILHKTNAQILKLFKKMRKQVILRKSENYSEKFSPN